MIIVCCSCSPDNQAEKVIQKSIAFHDPNNQWTTFSDTLAHELQLADGTKRFSEIFIDLPNNYFSLNATKDSITATFIIDDNKCKLKLNGNEDFSPTDAIKHDVFCERAISYKNSYEYLYGLPMKLRDPGTNFNSVESTSFKGNEYLKVNVSYDKKVGSDVWNFFINPKTYALEAYQFFKSDEVTGELIPGSGEYILLDGIEAIAGIKMPKNRKWYYNKDDKFLGKDFLK